MIRIDPSSRSLSGRIFFSVCCAMLLPSAAHAACSKWDISGKWLFSQSNDAWGSFTWQQTGTQIKGSGQSKIIAEINGNAFDAPLHTASIDGTINGDIVDFTAHWSNGDIGIYLGKIDPEGDIKGTTFERSDPQNKATWHVSPAGWIFTCLSSDPGSPPGVALGRVQGSPEPPPQRIGDEPPICARARSAMARNSPVAPSLRKQCLAAGGNFVDRPITQAPSSIRARNVFAISHAAASAPPAESPRMPGDRPPQGGSFAPPLFDDGGQLWACVNTADGDARGAACDGLESGKASCRAHGYSGELQVRRDGASGVTVAPARAGRPVRATNGDVCRADNCTVVSELDCAP